MGLRSCDCPTLYFVFVPRFDDFVTTNYELFNFVVPENLVKIKIGGLKLLRTLTKFLVRKFVQSLDEVEVPIFPVDVDNSD